MRPQLGSRLLAAADDGSAKLPSAKEGETANWRCDRDTSQGRWTTDRHARPRDRRAADSGRDES